MLRRIREFQATPGGAAFPVGQMLCAGLVVATAVYAMESLVVSQGRVDAIFDTFVYNGLLVAASLVCLARGLLVRGERLPWLLLGTALALWTTGDLYYYFFLSGAAEVPIPSLADPFYLAFYPVSYVALALLLRTRMRGFRGRLWLDGVIGSLAVAALGAALVFEKVLSTTDGSALVVATNLAYPLADLLLLSLVVAMFGLTGWRFDATWALVALGFAVFAIADSVYLYETAAGTYVEGGPLDVGWPAALVLIACSAWQPIRKLEGVRDDSWALAVPTVLAGAGLMVLVYDHFVRINTLAVVLSAATIAAVIVRAVLTFRERVALLAASREEALTDALTGLGNRGDSWPISGARSPPSDPTALVVFDLDGFKAYNDSFGHAAGDTLLSRVAGRLGLATADFGTAYRLGGDEFCVLASIEQSGLGSVIDRAAEALTEEGEGFAVSCSYGAVLMPAEASALTDALRMADDRMYLHKQRNRPSGHQQTAEVLLSALDERDSLLAHHLADVADLAEAVSRRLNVPAAAGPDDPPGGRAARRRQARDSRGDPHQARAADSGRVGVRAPPHPHRRADPRLRGGAEAGRRDRPLEPRALGRRRLPGSAAGRGDPAGGADHRSLQRLRGDDVDAPVRVDPVPPGGDPRARPLRGDAVRSTRGGRVCRRAGGSDRGARGLVRRGTGDARPRRAAQ